MEHITKEYGMDVNFLKVSKDEYKVLEPFLLALGVRTRITTIEGNEYTIQAENSYKTWMNNPHDRKCAEDQLKGFTLQCWQR